MPIIPACGKQEMKGEDQELASGTVPRDCSQPGLPKTLSEKNNKQKTLPLFCLYSEKNP